MDEMEDKIGAILNNPQMMQQYNTFKTNLIQNPHLQEQAMQEVMQKSGMKIE